MYELVGKTFEMDMARHAHFAGVVSDMIVDSMCLVAPPLPM